MMQYWQRRSICGILIMILVLICFAAGCSSSDKEDKDVLSISDFIVEVESGREAVILQLTAPQIIDSSQ